MKLRNIFTSILAVGTICLSPFALAVQPLTIHNNTDFPSATIANNGPCSNILSDGVTQPHSTNVVGEKSIKAACILNKENCDARVYLSANCTGPVVARVLFSINTGIKTVTNEPGSDYCIKGSGFEVTLDHKDSGICN
jgi:hypothetical protein